MRMEGGVLEGWGQQTGDGQLERIQKVGRKPSALLTRDRVGQSARQECDGFEGPW